MAAIEIKRKDLTARDLREASAKVRGDDPHPGLRTIRTNLRALA